MTCQVLFHGLHGADTGVLAVVPILFGYALVGYKGGQVALLPVQQLPIHEQLLDAVSCRGLYPDMPATLVFIFFSYFNKFYNNYFLLPVPPNMGYIIDLQCFKK